MEIKHIVVHTITVTMVVDCIPSTHKLSFTICARYVMLTIAEGIAIIAPDTMFGINICSNKYLINFFISDIIAVTPTFDI